MEVPGGRASCDVAGVGEPSDGVSHGVCEGPSATPSSSTVADLVFLNGAQALIDNSGFRRNVFNPSVRALGLSPVTPHCLRDTAASPAVSVGR